MRQRRERTARHTSHTKDIEHIKGEDTANHKQKGMMYLDKQRTYGQEGNTITPKKERGGKAREGNLTGNQEKDKTKTETIVYLIDRFCFPFSDFEGGG